MCGIAGLITHDPEERLAAMLRKIEHRGFDDEGTWFSDPFGGERLRAGLGHRRLAILDPTPAGHQPFFSADGRFVLTYNGEIYNYREIRRELAGRGCRFRTDCDTEVLVEAFRTWGAECLGRLNGMFAFAVWDDREKELFLARDRAGIKPLYYARTGERIVFASEIKSVLAAGLVEAALDLAGLHEFLTFLWPVPPRTLFAGIEQLPPAHYLVWKDGRVRTVEWWDLDFSREETNDADEDRWREEVFATLERVTRMEMVSDVPLGAFLSGGVDSSTIVALMTRHSRERVATYTTAIAAEDLSYDIIPDDVEWSRKLAAELPVDYHETLQTPDLADLLPKLVYHQDAPVIDMAIPSYLISEQSRRRLKVMLSGMGGDEVFAGYPRHLAMRYAGVTDLLPGAVRRPLFATLESLLPGGLPGRLTAPLRNAKKFARSAAAGYEDRYLGFGTYFTDAHKTRLYTADLRRETAGFDAYRRHRLCFERCQGAAPLNRLLYVDFKTFLPALNLDTTDKTSMAANLEVRVPFLNHELVSLGERLPASLKLKGLTRKYILKKAAERVVPPEIVWRKKAGFSAPIRSWLRSGLRPQVRELLSEETVRRRGLFDPAEVRRLIELNESGKEDYNLQVFQLLTFEIWQRTFLD